jgi:hypothetical protein
MHFWTLAVFCRLSSITSSYHQKEEGWASKWKLATKGNIIRTPSIRREYPQSYTVPIQTVLRGTYSFVKNSGRIYGEFPTFYGIILYEFPHLNPAWLPDLNRRILISFSYKLQQRIHVYWSVSNSPMNFRCVYEHFQILSSVVFQLKWI